jgi:bifunctional non-homologous end joining protein LigD
MARSAASAKLAKYRSMRDFSRTAEPGGDHPTAEPGGDHPTAEPGHSFVVQQHAARRMHYDFRLELDGVLLSWSVPKGPSLSPAERRLAVRTEDHPLDYAGFEGKIPEGQYGSGTVVVWDRGTWQPEGDARAAITRGRLTFTLHGEKLRGRWHLIRLPPAGKAENWLLFKGRDGAANDEIDILAAEPASVLSGRTLDEIASSPDRVWQSTRAAEPTVADKRAARIAAARPSGPRTGRDNVLSIVEQLQRPLGFKLTNLGKILYPDQGITKGELMAYFAAVADWALPHIANRPLTLLRCPDGIRSRASGGTKPCFFQKHLSAGAPPAIEAVAIAETGATGETGATADYMQIHDMPGLVALAQLGTLEVHTWGAHADSPEQPDLLAIDLDPDVGLAWDRIALGAFELRRRLREAGLESFVKTTGNKGLHVVAPITRGIEWDQLKAFSKAIAMAMERDEPALYTTNLSKAHRKGKIFLDYLRNGRGATFIAPYSPRAQPGAPVATPVSWDELAHGIDPATFTTATVPRRLAGLPEDPWKDLTRITQSITASAWRSVGDTP